MADRLAVDGPTLDQPVVQQPVVDQPAVDRIPIDAVAAGGFRDDAVGPSAATAGA